MSIKKLKKIDNDTLVEKTENTFNNEVEGADDDEEVITRHGSIKTPEDAVRQLAADIVAGACSDYRAALRQSERTPSLQYDKKMKLEYSKLFFHSAYYGAICNVDGKYLLDLFQAEYEEENKAIKSLVFDTLTNKAWCGFCHNEMKLQSKDGLRWVGVCYACKYNFVRYDFLELRDDALDIVLKDWKGTKDIPELESSEPKCKPKILGRLKRTRFGPKEYLARVDEVTFDRYIYKIVRGERKVAGVRYKVVGEVDDVDYEEADTSTNTGRVTPQELDTALQDSDKVSETEIEVDDPTRKKHIDIEIRAEYGSMVNASEKEKRDRKRAIEHKAFLKERQKKLDAMTPEDRHLFELGSKSRLGTITIEESLELRRLRLKKRGVSDEEIAEGERQAINSRNFLRRAKERRKEVDNAGSTN